MKETFGCGLEPADSSIVYVDFHNVGRFWV